MECLRTEFATLPWSTTHEKKLNDITNLAVLCDLDYESIILSIQYFYDIPISTWKNELVEPHALTIPVILASKFYELEPFHSSAIEKMANVNFHMYSLAEVLCLEKLDYCLYKMDLVNTWVNIVKLLDFANKTLDDYNLVFFCFLKILSQMEMLENMNFDHLSRATLMLADVYNSFEHLFEESPFIIDSKLKEHAKKIILTKEKEQISS